MLLALTSTPVWAAQEESPRGLRAAKCAQGQPPRGLCAKTQHPERAGTRREILQWLLPWTSWTLQEKTSVDLMGAAGNFSYGAAEKYFRGPTFVEPKWLS